MEPTITQNPDGTVTFGITRDFAGGVALGVLVMLKTIDAARQEGTVSQEEADRIRDLSSSIAEELISSL